MKAILLAHEAVFVVVLATGCGANMRVDQWDPLPPPDSACAAAEVHLGPEPTPPIESSPTALVCDSDLRYWCAGEGQLCPLDPSRWCPFGVGKNARMSLHGDVYLWHPLAPCKRKIRSKRGEAHDWLDTGYPCGPDAIFGVTPEEECVVRGNKDEALEMVISPHGNRGHGLRKAGWRVCSGEEIDQVMSSPDCR